MFKKPDSYKSLNSSEYVINNKKKDNDIINDMKNKIINLLKNMCFK